MVLEGTQEAPQQEAQGQETQEQEVQQESQQRDDFSRRFELLARKEREIMEMGSRYKSQEQQWIEKEAKLKQYEDDYGMIEKDPLSFLSKRGWDQDKLAEYMINNHGDPYQQKYEQKLSALEKRLDEEREERQNELRRRTYQQKINDIQDIVQQDSDRFELINGKKAYNLVLDTMAEYYNRYGESLSPRDAAEQVENYLEKELDQIVQYKKVKSRFGQFNKPNEEDLYGYENESIVQPPQQRRPSTLTNSFAPVDAPNSNRQLTREESIKRAAALIKWND